MTRSQHLRVWQRDALELYQRTQPRDFLTVATPGAGKTTFALTIAADLMSRGIVERVVIVTPTDHLKTQWALAASGIGITLDPSVTGQGRLGADFDGFAVTYAGLAVNANSYRTRIDNRPTMVILDEIHHAADALSWGEAVQEACEPAIRRLSLTGTPFRSDDNPIPFVTYAPADDGTISSVADFSYGYGHALRDGVVRPVLFMAYSGQMHWRTRAGDEVAARLGEPLDRAATAQALRTALDPQGSWIPAVLQAAHTRLMEVRRDVPDAGGLVIASDQDTARQYAAVLAGITGHRPDCRAVRRARLECPHRRLLRRHDAVDGRGAHGQRGRRHSAALGRCLRNDDGDPALLRPGSRPLRTYPATRRDGVDLRAERSRRCWRSPRTSRHSAIT